MNKFLTEESVFQSEGKIKTVLKHEHIQEREEYPGFLKKSQGLAQSTQSFSKKIIF